MSDNLRKNIVNPSIEDYHWQAAIDSLLFSGDIYIPRTKVNEEIVEVIESNILLTQILIDKPCSFIKRCNILVKDNSDKTKHLSQIYHKIYVTLNRAQNLGLVEVSENKESVDGDSELFVDRYSLTREGLQTALKFQEHNDNKARYEQTKSIMIGSLGVSFCSLIVALLALLCK
tara:strand:- start:2552 stop:3073 length:522 start_codon:yes stop_codon:yes gene_type:complete